MIASPAEDRLGTCSIAVFAPSPALTITIESGPPGPEVHLHPGGQGYWVGRMAARLGADVTLCMPLGGESGAVLNALLAAEPVAVLSTHVGGANGSYVHDRREGHRVVISETESPALRRHELDDLYDTMLAASLDADIALLTGPRNAGVLPAQVYERLTRDLRENDVRVLADLSGEPLRASLRGGLELVKGSVEELLVDGWARAGHREAVAGVARRLHSAGAEMVVVSRGAEGAIALFDGRLFDAHPPRVSEVDVRGAGDSMFAALGVGLGSGLDPEDALRMAVAAGTLNVTRHGLGTGRASEIRRLAGHVGLIELKMPADAG